MTLESQLKDFTDTLKSVDKTLNALGDLIARLAHPPMMVETPLDPELYGATQWRGYLARAPRDTVDPAPPPIDYMSGQWKRRDGHGVQQDLGSGVGKTLQTQQLDPWARRSPPAEDV